MTSDRDLSRSTAVTIDVDGIGHYNRLHGLAAPADRPDPVYSTAIPRFLDLLEEAAVPATFFVIGRELADHEALFQTAAARGSELASHSYDHDYGLFRRPYESIVHDLRRAKACIEAVSGAPVAGFRAPGYNLSPALMRACRDVGHRYDASVLPCPAYYAARAGALAWYRWRGRSSASFRGRWGQFSGETAPYWVRPEDGPRPAAAAAEASSALLELPISVTPHLRIPALGTLWTELPDAAHRHLFARWAQRGPIHVELHAIDLLDHHDPDIHIELADKQPSLRTPWATKKRALRTLLSLARHHGDVLTLKEISERWTAARPTGR